MAVVDEQHCARAASEGISLRFHAALHSLTRDLGPDVVNVRNHFIHKVCGELPKLIQAISLEADLVPPEQSLPPGLKHTLQKPLGGGSRFQETTVTSREKRGGQRRRRAWYAFLSAGVRSTLALASTWRRQDSIVDLLAFPPVAGL